MMISQQLQLISQQLALLGGGQQQQVAIPTAQ